MPRGEKNRIILFRVEGIVQQGEKRGTELGFPTANIPCFDSVPGGIYAGEILWKSVSYPAALYKEDGKDMIEAHVLDFSGNLYGERLTVFGYRKVRDVRSFSKQEELIAAISKDIADAKKLCSVENNDG